MIYFVGGASASGKSTVAQKLADTSGLRHFELDTLHNAFKQSLGKDPCPEVMNTATAWFLEQMLAAGSSGVIEGGWMWPDKAKELIESSGGRLCAVFCGYFNADPADRLQMIQSHTGSMSKHWLATLEPSQALDWISAQITGSKDYKEQAENCGLPFFDFTDVHCGAERLFRHFNQWLDRIRAATKQTTPNG